MPPRDKLAAEIFGSLVPDPPPRASIGDLLKRWAFWSRMSNEEALYTLLHGAVVIDGRIDPDEIAVLQLLSARSKHLGKAQKEDPRKFVDMQKRVHDRLKSVIGTDKIWAPIMEACQTVPSEWGPSAFAHVCDLVMADRTMAPIESRYVKTAAEYLSIDPTEAQLILRCIRIKNEHVEDYDPGPPGSIDIDEETSTDPEFEDLGVMSPQEAVYAINLCAAMADGTRLLVEGVELEALSRIKSLAACTERMRHHIARKVFRMGENRGWGVLLRDACRHLPEPLRLSVYGQAVDLTFADLHLHNDEKKFLKDLQKHLELESSHAALDMFRVIRIKNAH